MNPADAETPRRLLAPAALADAETTYRRLTMQTFAFEIQVGHYLAFVRTFASPRVAGLLVRTGEMEANPRRRATDTGLSMYEMIHHGLDSPEGQEITRNLNALHHRWKIHNNDYLWVLGTFAVLGIQVIDRYGWRKLTDHERQATIDWYRELGTRMGITDIPETYQQFAAWFKAYEQSHLKRTDAGDRLIAATREIVLARVPRPLRPAALRAAAVIVDDPARTALAMHQPGWLNITAVTGLLRLRAIWRRHQPDPEPWFQTGASSEVYPQGYAIRDLGPIEGNTKP